MMYDGFISYSHAADDLLAPRLQAGLQRFAKPWWKRRAVRIFRDESSLAANPHLWSSITEALDDSEWFVLLLSPEAASSEWVGREIEHWTENGDPSRILPVVTDGEFGWNSAGDVTGSSVPPALHSVFAEEPRWVDLRFARDEDQLDLKNPEFSNAIADVASAIRGVAKDELASEEVRQHRRTVRTAWAAGMAVLVLGIGALVGAIVAVNQSNEARVQRDEAELQAARADDEADRASQEADRANRLAGEEAEARAEAEEQATRARAQQWWTSAALAVEQDPALASLLALQAADLDGATPAIGATEVGLLWRSLLEDRTLLEIAHGFGGHTSLGLSGDGSLLAISSSEGTRVQAYRVPAGELLWEYAEDTADSFSFVWANPDGTRVAVGIVDSAAETSERGDSGVDRLPNRVVILDGRDGRVEHLLEFPDCLGVDTLGWSPDGSYFLVNSGGGQACEREGAEEGNWVEVLDGATFESIALLPSPGGGVPRMDDSGRLFVFSLDEDVLVFEPPTFSVSRSIPDTFGLGAVSPDGSLIVTETAGGGAFGVRVFEVDTGRRVDLLDLPEFGTRPLGWSFSPDGSQLIAATEGSQVIVWDVAEGREVVRLPGGPAVNGAMAPDGSVVYTAHIDGFVRAWDMTASSAGATGLADLGNHEWVNGNSFRIGPDLGAFANFDLSAPEFDPLARFFDLDTGEIVNTHGGVPIGPLADGRFLISLRGLYTVYDPRTGESSHLLGCTIDLETETCIDTGEPAEAWDVWVTSDGRQLVATQEDLGMLHVLDPDSGDVLSSEPLVATGFPLLFGTDWYLAWAEGEVLAAERVSGDILFSDRLVPATRELNDGRDRLAIADADIVTLIDLTTWEPKEFRIANDGRVRGMAFSPNNDLLAVGQADALNLYDLATGAIFLTIPIEGVSDIHWLTDGAVVAGTWSGGWLRVPLDPTELIASVRAELRRGFTDEECIEHGIDPCPSLEDMKEG